MTAFVKVNTDVLAALGDWAGHAIKTGSDNRRCPAHHAALHVIADAALLSTGDALTKSGKMRSLTAAKRLEATCREIAARAGVRNITTMAV